MTKSMTRDEQLVNLALDEAPMLRAGYRDTSVKRIIETVDRMRGTSGPSVGVREVEAVLARIPPEHVVRVHEGGGPEDVFASLAVTVAKLVRNLEHLTLAAIRQPSARPDEAVKEACERVAEQVLVRAAGTIDYMADNDRDYDPSAYADAIRSMPYDGIVSSVLARKEGT